MTQDSTNLDLLRSFAVLFVLFDHTLKFWGMERIAGADINWLGRLGVAFFFVHTSLVLMMSLERTRLTGWRLSANFYLRRAFRI
jgi:peptidoglycan/LPS O-acetylase OafA/YrhL